MMLILELFHGNGGLLKYGEIFVIAEVFSGSVKNIVYVASQLSCVARNIGNVTRVPDMAKSKTSKHIPISYRIKLHEVISNPITSYHISLHLYFQHPGRIAG